MNPPLAVESTYTDGSYLARHPSWHLEDSPFKANQIAGMLARHPEVQPDSICEIGCGAGGILSELTKLLPGHITFTGYEISPQAHAMSTRFSNARCHYILGDAFADDSIYDLVLVMDVVEHVEDCFAFLRQSRRKGRLKIYNIPLETHVTALLRGLQGFDTFGHVHLFTIETAIKSLEYTGHRVVDWTFAPVALAEPHKKARTRLANLVRVPLAKVNPKLTARLIGGYSILILAE
jgi:SAM-dependent methyltransferase